MMNKYILLTSFLLSAVVATAQDDVDSEQTSKESQEAPSYQQCMDLAQQQLTKAQEALAEEAAALAAGEMPAQDSGVEASIDERVGVRINPYGDVEDMEVGVDLSLDEDHVPEKPTVAKECKVRYGIVF